MKKHVLWLAVAVAAFVLVTAYRMRRKPDILGREQRMRNEKWPLPPGIAPPAGNQAAPKNPVPELPVRSGKTLDLSREFAMANGSENERAIVDRSRKELEAALQKISDAPAPTPGENKRPLPK